MLFQCIKEHESRNTILMAIGSKIQRKPISKNLHKGSLVIYKEANQGYFGYVEYYNYNQIF